MGIVNTSGHIYFVKPIGWGYEVWFRYTDGQPDPYSHATEWFASTIKFWRREPAERLVLDLSRNFNNGIYVGQARAAAGYREP